MAHLVEGLCTPPVATALILSLTFSYSSSFIRLNTIGWSFPARLPFGWLENSYSVEGARERWADCWAVVANSAGW